MAQAFPVLLVIRNSEGEVRWMEVREWLKRARENGRKLVKEIVFEGERFDLMGVRRRWRERVVAKLDQREEEEKASFHRKEGGSIDAVPIDAAASSQENRFISIAGGERASTVSAPGSWKQSHCVPSRWE